jgi:sulfite reductase alpha subunit-like flavoprotein
VETSTALELEYQHLTAATKIISQRYENSQIDLDDTIEELRPIRMRMYAISSQLKVKKDEVCE